MAVPWAIDPLSHFELQADGEIFSPSSMIAVEPGIYERDRVRVTVAVTPFPDGSADVTLTATGVRHVHDVCLLNAPLAGARNYRWYDQRGLQRTTAVFGPDWFACYANPHGYVEITGGHVRLWYRPAMDVADETFVSDPLVCGPVHHTGRIIRKIEIPGRDPAGGGFLRATGGPAELDEGEVRAMRRAVAARIPWAPARMRVGVWDWGANLYRLDPDDAAPVYDRLAQLAADIGAEDVLIAPSGTYRFADEAGTVGDMPWQNIMWFGHGHDFATGELSLDDDPPQVAAVRKHGLGVVPYANPQDVRDPVVAGNTTCLASKDAVDRLIARADRFFDHYSTSGVSLDFVAWHPCNGTGHGHEPGEDARYAQWDGYRRAIAHWRDRQPDAWIEALIGSQMLLPWGARDMTHPHPLLTDNQPQWVNAWPDLSMHRANANYQRRVAFWMRNFAFLPTYKIPGQVSHQANRRVYADVERGWDWEGARYNLLSAIASAPSTLSICFLPCWDEAEWSAVRSRDGAFFAHWIAWAKEHAAELSQLEDLFEEPRPGTVDGTSTGRFIFLTNPDYVTHRVALDHLVRELHPVPNRLWEGHVDVEPHEVFVLERIDPPAVPYVTGVMWHGPDHFEGTPGTSADAVLHDHDGAQRLRIDFASDGVTPVVSERWAPGARLPSLLSELAPGVAPVGDELLQPWSDPSRLRLYLGAGTQAPTLRIDGAEVPVRKAYIGTYEHVQDGFLNLLGHYADVTDLLTGDLDREWTVETDAPEVHVAHLPRRTTTDATIS